MKKIITLVCVLTVSTVISSGRGSPGAGNTTNANSPAANKPANAANQATNTTSNTNTNATSPSSTNAADPSSDSKPTAAKPTVGKPDFTVTAIEMYKEYEASEDKATKKYAGKTVHVKGILKEPDLQKQSYGYEVKFETGGLAEWVTCYFGEESLEDFKPLKAGQTVTLQGVGEDVWVGGPNLKNCIVVPGK